MKFVRDLWMGQGNVYWELARILGTLAMMLMTAAVGWNVHLGQPIDLAALGGGLAGILTSAAALIALKDRARANPHS
jgi:uncharacterized transporter YbjL